LRFELEMKQNKVVIFLKKKKKKKKLWMKSEEDGEGPIYLSSNVLMPFGGI